MTPETKSILRIELWIIAILIYTLGCWHVAVRSYKHGYAQNKAYNTETPRP